MSANLILCWDEPIICHLTRQPPVFLVCVTSRQVNSHNWTKRYTPRKMFSLWLHLTKPRCIERQQSATWNISLIHCPETILCNFPSAAEFDSAAMKRDCSRRRMFQITEDSSRIQLRNNSTDLCACACYRVLVKTNAKTCCKLEMPVTFPIS